MRHLLALIMLAAALAGNAYDGVGKLFVEENGDLFNSLSLSTRYELLNNYDRETKSEVTNNLHTSESRILDLSNDFMRIATSSGKTVEMKLLNKSARDTIIAVIETVDTRPYKDSRISFYDTKWNKLPTKKFITLPTIDDFFLPSATRQQREELKNAITFTMIEMKIEGNTLVATCNLSDFFMGESFKSYSSIVKGKIEYSINKASFKKK